MSDQATREQELEVRFNDLIADATVTTDAYIQKYIIDIEVTVPDPVV